MFDVELTSEYDALGNIVSRQSSLGEACIEQFARLDLLVNNAGIYHVANAEQTSDDAWTETIAINLSAPFFLSREAIPYLRDTKGTIVNIASDWGLAGGKNAVAYCASKGGLVLMTRAMALDHAAEGIRINAEYAAVGLFRTVFTGVINKLHKQFRPSPGFWKFHCFRSVIIQRNIPAAVNQSQTPLCR